ncbi:MAG TPA: rod shape-determining protein MreD [Eubacteriaceae bacterium]|nr:rod shape-determining protein MreD [Eubacteriaceae bacterium]
MRLFILSLLLLAEIIIESSILPFIKIKGVTPDLVLITIVSMGLIYGKKEGIILGLIGGIFSDILFGRILGIHGLPYMLIGYLVGFASEKVYKENRIIPYLFTLIATLSYQGILYLIIYLARIEIPMDIYIRKYTAFSLIINGIIVIFIYPFFLKLSEWNLIKQR